MLIAFGIISTVGFTVWHVHSAWALLGLVFLAIVVKTTSFATTCPHCGFVFTVMTKDDDGEPIAKFSIASALLALAICGIVGVAVYFIGSGWVLLGLIFLPLISPKLVFSVKCESCGQLFNAVPNEDDDEDFD